MMIRLLMICLVLFPALSHAEIDDNTWSLKASSECDSYTIKLKLPALDMGCELDMSSGNPSSWFNPFETCELNFDLIGLPTLDDIKMGIGKQVCNQIQKVKSATVDEMLNEIDEKTNFELDLVDEWKNLVEAKPSTETDETGASRCYSYDTDGRKIIVPCSMGEPIGTDLNECYVDSGNSSEPFEYLPCSRFTPEAELCITGWYYDEYGEKRYTIGGCTSKLAQENAFACGAYSDPIYCSDYNGEVSQYDRLCTLPQRSDDNNSSETSDEAPTRGSCSLIEKACYGHLGGVFKAAQCLDFHDKYYGF
ncbi:hypothetical protein [Vibrio sp. Hal054]|uniref:hypothetical protein n=1 Tax=Vibrio sp. Hal054 TaxID=3035158 RepID=UPI00301D7EED